MSSLLNALLWSNSYLLTYLSDERRKRGVFHFKTLDRTKFDLISVLTLIEMICPYFGKTNTQGFKKSTSG